RTSDGSTISSNKILNVRSGIWLWSSSSNTISNNVIVAGNGSGISMNGHHIYGSSSYNVVSRNVIVAHNGTGVRIEGGWAGECYNNTITKNDMVNSDFGIYFDHYSSNNYVYANNFTGNNLHAFSDPSVNFWNTTYSYNGTHGSGGNYWSNYTGVDFYHGPNQDIPGSDYVGDTPHTIDEDDIDYYPLMGDNRPPSTPTITAPNGGEYWSSTQTINWTASYDPDGDPITYMIEYSLNSGASWNTLASAISGTVYAWDTTIHPDSNNYLVRVRAFDGFFYSGWDESNSTFVVDNTLPVVNITYPIESQVVKAGTIWVSGKVTELNGGTLEPSIDDPGFNLSEWDGTTFAFRNSSYIEAGSMLVMVSFADLAGNTGNDTVSFTYSPEIGGTVISVTPSTMEIPRGSTGDVAVEVSNVSDLLAWQVVLYFNGTIMNATEAWLPGGHVFEGQDFVEAGPVWGEDYVMYSVSLLGSDWTFNGSGTLCFIRFQGLTPGSSTLRFDEIDTILIDSSQNVIPSQKSGGWISVLGLHNVAVMSPTTVCGAFPEYETQKTVVCQNYTLTFNVTVKNGGDFDETNVVVSAFANGMEFANQTIALLPEGFNETLSFTWDTTGWPKGNHTISFNATIPLDADPLDNTCNLSWDVAVTMAGDVNNDRSVDILDIVKVALVYGSEVREDRYEPNCDFNDDGKVDIRDIVVVAIHYGETDP
ncbi:MAG: right-handed parallel beta-helix repeat-containing protein, partial [Thermoplasmata archaeon]|nr:right-handed parallel beta-helix repeat-containing protein [Thermoplasmata archaeon]